MRKKKEEKKYDLILKIILCSVHKEWLEKSVKYRDKDKKVRINTFNLGNLIETTQHCDKCKWETIFGE